jgi:hypothetical protein
MYRNFLCYFLPIQVIHEKFVITTVLNIKPQNVHIIVGSNTIIPVVARLDMNQKFWTARGIVKN